MIRTDLDEPGKPNAPDIEDYDIDHVDLKWEPPIDDGGAPIEGYILEFKKKDGKDWKKVLSTCRSCRSSAVK